ncbi:MAG: LytTR family DNA-binding domain-containing protein [Pseudomonadota bacterium]
MTLQNYLRYRRYYEIGLAVLITVISFLANLGVEIIEGSRYGADPEILSPVILEGTSHLAMLLSIPLLLLFDRRFPIRAGNVLRNGFMHLAFSVLFSLCHVTLMYWSRVLVFGIKSPATPYRWNNWLGEFGYEYLKDFRTYLLILALVYLYRFVLRRLQGEAGFVSEGSQVSAAVSDRFLVKKLGREFLVRVDEIDWIESCGNYVNLHVGERVYPLRETMTRIDQRLVPMGFQRVHRSAIVNLERISEIVAFDSGDGEAKLDSDATVPVSRRFRKQLRDRLT